MLSEETELLTGDQRASRFLTMLQESRRGKLKIYLGMAPGVGKTFRMLSEAHTIIKKGFDVYIGYIETHNRSETQALVAGIPIIDRRKFFYKGKYLEEMDLETILLLKPDVVLVDELPHTNAPGSKNEKRWQDVIDILDTGIHVISALNIQHIERINSEVERITQVAITERVPDLILKRADEIVNVDLTTDELIDRLKTGKIYELNKVQHALVNFFQQDKLLQLRELALKEAVLRLERKIEKELALQGERPSINYTAILSCISTNEESGKKIIQKSARWALFLGLKWQVIYVETPKEHPEKIKLALQRGLINNYKLATDLGAEIIRVQHNSVSQGLIDYISQNKINLIVVGRCLRPYWMFWRENPINVLLNNIPNLDVMILS